MSSYLGAIWNRLNLENVPPEKRAYQVANAILVSVLGERWRVSHVVEYPKCGGSWVSNMLRSYIGVTFNDGLRFVQKDDVVQKHSLYRSLCPIRS